MNVESEDIYAAVADLIGTLRVHGQHRMAIILEHRMYKVSWTSSSELFEELANVLKNFLEEGKGDLDRRIIMKAEQIVRAIESSVND